MPFNLNELPAKLTSNFSFSFNNIGARTVVQFSQNFFMAFQFGELVDFI